jgi:glucosamine--fructose-6-phosphate aminotransferase (isomerizing)
MCGIVGVVSRPPTRPAPSRAELIAALDEALSARPDASSVAEGVQRVDHLLRGVPGIVALVDQYETVAAITARLDALDAFADEQEALLESSTMSSEQIEGESATLIALRDALWAVRRDRLRSASEVAKLAGREAGVAALAGYHAVQQSLSAIDRLEVRGRDSAGLHLFVWNADLDDADPGVSARTSESLFQSGSVRHHDGCWSFVYKAAAEIGELGDNTSALRRAIAGDDLLRRALACPTARVAALAHTRWASVGIISEPNAHPVNSDQLDATTGGDSPYVVAALNGDVDNHADLRIEHGLHIDGPISTDAKVIPVLMATLARRATSGNVDAFRRTVIQFDGSVAIAAGAHDDPDVLLLALRGSGQALYVGLGDDCYVVASEPYGLIEETSRYVRMDGEHGGQIIALEGSRSGELAGITRIGYDGEPQPVRDDDVVVAEVTTRDIDRGEAPHFLLKEITEAPDSLHKTLRGRIVGDDEPRIDVGERTLPPSVAARLASGEIRRVRVIGQGTAAVAGQSLAAILDELTGGRLDVDAVLATEMSGFNLRRDMGDTLAIAVSQSGTTTDTNRTVDLLRSRGAAVISIVNRRNSDLCDKSDGVLYTSDGRDVEMSVASTKAFYAQVAAGVLLACAISEAAGLGTDARRAGLARSLRELPDAMRTVLQRRPEIAAAAHRFAPHKRYWAVVGNGPNTVAAEEVRIKLSELCYKSIACDVTEDKKHIDLSCEPMIIVCATGLSGGTADDVGKEIAIFRAHKATPIVIVSEGSQRYDAAATITVPSVDPALGFVLSTMVGHLFGYEAALAIDASARPLRQVREAIELLIGESTDGDDLLARLPGALRTPVDRYLDGLRSGRYDGNLEASTAVRLVGLMRNVLSDRPLEEYQFDSGKVATPANLIDDLVNALTQAIDELTRPIDAIKHQAKTVTVGISRSDEGVLDRALVQAVLDAGTGRDALTYRTIKVLADLDPAVSEVTGFTRYGIDHDTIEVVDRGGISRTLSSRVEHNARLVGTKRRVASEREVLVARGRSDGRTLIFVPEVKAGTCTGITLLHVRFRPYLGAAAMRSVLEGYDRRYDRLVDWVTETEGSFDDARLAEVPVDQLLIDPISDTADRWRASPGPA